jgi:hypothetical protein
MPRRVLVFLDIPEVVHVSGTAKEKPLLLRITSSYMVHNEDTGIVGANGNS